MHLQQFREQKKNKHKSDDDDEEESEQGEIVQCVYVLR